MGRPKIMTESDRDGQLDLDFSTRFSEIAWKEGDKAVIGILKGLAILGLGETEVDIVMNTIKRFAPLIADHASKD